ncbi:MAG: hypothetical protein K2X76_16210 [Sphingomonas sp.]|nr:hypothetical protein [Sphingomonas sp.]
MIPLRPFDPAEHIDSIDMAREYLAAAAEGDDSAHIERAMDDVDRAEALGKIRLQGV